LHSICNLEINNLQNIQKNTFFYNGLITEELEKKQKICHTIEKIEKCMMQNAEIVERTVKYHSNQNKIDLYIAENVSKITNQNHEIETDLVEDKAEDLVEEMIDHEKCMMQNAEIVEMIVKYHSNQKKTDLYIAENVSKITDNISKLF